MTESSNPFAPIAFAELEGKKKSTLVAEKILEAMQQGRFQPRTKLPSEREICDQMGVSRTVVREALSALRIVGAVTVRMGEGTYVSEKMNQFFPMSKTIALLEQNESPMEIWSARQYLERTVGEIAIIRAGSKEHQMAMEVFDEMVAKGTAGDLDGHMLANHQFHWLFYRIADNSILIRIGNWLLNLTDQIITKKTTHEYLYRDINQSLGVHQKILDAFVGRNQQDFRDAIDHHFDILKNFYMKEYD